MKLSVIIPTYNRCECLKAALNSLLVQEEIEPGDFEVLVVDNNSTDNTKTIVGSFEKNFNGRMKYIFEQKQGVAHAINAGIIASKGELVATIGDDCRVDTKWAAKIRSVFETKNIDLLAGKIIARFDGPHCPIGLIYQNSMAPWHITIKGSTIWKAPKTGASSPRGRTPY